MGGVRYPRWRFPRETEWLRSVDNPFLRRLNGFLTSSDVASDHAFLGTTNVWVDWADPTAARGMTSDGLVTYQSTCLSTARGVQNTAADLDNGCLRALMPTAHIEPFGLAHSPLGGSENAAGIAAWLRARVQPEAVDQVTLVGVVPGRFDTNGGEFTLTVSPRDASGDYVDVVLDLADFSLFGIEGLAAALERVSASGGTPLYGAILDAVSVAAGASNEDRAIVVFTDGEAGDQHLAATAVDAAVASGMPVFTIGLGSGVGTAALQDLAAATGGTFAEAADAGGLEAVFDAVGAGISGGRILVTARGSFAPPLMSAGRFVVRGTLRTHVPAGAFDTGFRFVVDVVEAD